jgi:hypothetical protein
VPAHHGRVTRASCTGWSDAPLEPRDRIDKLAALLTYGDAYAGPAGGELVVVMPRLGTVSPWASKATDIARNCGLAAAPGRAGHRVPAAR